MVLKDFSKRVVVGSIFIFMIICFLLFALNSWFQYIVVAFIALLTGIALWEYAQFAKEKGGDVTLPAFLGFGVIQAISFFASVKWFHANGFVPLLIFFICFFVFIFLHFNTIENALMNLAVQSFGLLYIAVPMGMILGILYGQQHGQDGRLWVAYLLVVTKITDIGAYFGGCLLGRRKLAPVISPGKTVEGALVGLVCAVCASFVFYIISLSTGSAFHLRGVQWLWLGLILGCFGQFGDLAESLLKRDANKKDSNSLPGLGGVLDLVDSLLFNVFIIYFYLYQTACGHSL